MTVGRSDPRLHVAFRAHDGYAAPLEGGYRGYQARCWDCGWEGPEHLRGDEPMGTDESRAHKRAAAEEAAEHSRTHMIECCSRCRRSLTEIEETC